ncbi:MAG: hypothetical protein PHQ08_03265, partial [Candidatus Pacebacteria bacterium]|nr:hypothetical protein [Candidatus Paceibacterota bacterium]
MNKRKNIIKSILLGTILFVFLAFSFFGFLAEKTKTEIFSKVSNSIFYLANIEINSFAFGYGYGYGYGEEEEEEEEEEE